jgi:L,D-peptidoglycan transpeptidase YkuD (ErfK/YbiS/YcfS/YnhG family)
MIFTAKADGSFELAGVETQCALGREGVIPAEDKREGDGCSPLGVWPIRRVLYRPDRQAPPETALPIEAMAPDDGWCDAPTDPNYNRQVKLPYPASCEQMWREDGVYDIVVVLGHNDDPVRPAMGSAIFLHLAKPGYPGTEGCVALDIADMRRLLELAEPGAAVAIVDDDDDVITAGALGRARTGRQAGLQMKRKGD